MLEMDFMDPDCTAVLKIHKKFDEKFQDAKKFIPTDQVRGLNKHKSESNWMKQRWDTIQNESEIISLKANISQLNLTIQNLEKQLAEARICQKMEVQSMQTKHEGLKRQIEEMNQQHHDTSSKHEMAKEEIIQLRNELQTCKDELKQKTCTTLLLSAQSELEELKQVNSQRMKKYEEEIEHVKNTLTNITDENDLLRVQIKNKTTDVRRLELALEDEKHQLSILNQQIKDYELERSRSEENLKRSKWIQSRLERYEELDEENKRLKQEMSYLRAIQENSELLNEKCKSLQDKLSRSEKRCNELGDLELKHEQLKKRLTDFEPLFGFMPTLKCASDVIQVIEGLNHTNQVYAEANGSLKSSLHKLEDELATAQADTNRIRVELTDETSKREMMISQYKGIKHKLVLIRKERDSYKGILDSYENETTQVMTSPAQKKLKILEETRDGFKKQCIEKDAEIQKLSDMTQNLRKRMTFLEQQLVESEKQRNPRSSVSGYDKNIILSLQEKIVDLQRKFEKVCGEKDQIELRAERNDMLGQYNPGDMKVIKMRSTPYSNERQKLVRDLESLREENQTLKMRVKTMMESNTQEDLTTRTTQALASIGTVKEKEDLKAQLMSSELLTKRLKEKYEEVSQSFKSMVSKLLGYRVERAKDGIYKLASIFAESPNEYFIFEQSQEDVFTLMDNDYLSCFQDLIEVHLKGSDALPAFMSAVTLLLRERNGMDSTYMPE